MKYKGSDSNIHLIARILLVQEDSVILCKVPGASWYFLPGGHVEDGESVKTAIARELKEEVTGTGYEIKDFIGACENVFELDTEHLQHEMNITFEVTVPKDVVVRSKEDHIEFESVKLNTIKDLKILPKTMKDGILEWISDKKTFFKEI